MEITTKIRTAYSCHKANAKYRGIAFLLTFEEWVCLWLDSGKWELRGTKRGQYVMARPGDQGAYEVGNVFICLAEENRAERNRNYPMRGEKNPSFGKGTWGGMTPETAARRSASQRAKMTAVTLGRSRAEDGRFIRRHS